jgi:hypothetical protein
VSVKSGKGKLVESAKFIKELEKLTSARTWKPLISMVGLTIEFGSKRGTKETSFYFRNKKMIKGRAMVWRGKYSLFGECYWDFRKGNSTLVSRNDRKSWNWAWDRRLERKIRIRIKNRMVQSIQFDCEKHNLVVKLSGGYSFRFFPAKKESWTLFNNDKMRTWYAVRNNGISFEDEKHNQKN